MVTQEQIARQQQEMLACLEDIRFRLSQIEKQLPTEDSDREWYTTAEVAQLLGKAEFTVRQWCLNGRIHARKTDAGRGRTAERVEHVLRPPQFGFFGGRLVADRR